MKIASKARFSTICRIDEIKIHSAALAFRLSEASAKRRPAAFINFWTTEPFNIVAERNALGKNFYRNVAPQFDLVSVLK